MASLTDDRDAKISLAKEKLKKFQKKKANQTETSSLAGDSVNGSLGDVSLRSSPGLETRQNVPLLERISGAEQESNSRNENGNGNGEALWTNPHSMDVSASSQGVPPSPSKDFTTFRTLAFNGNGHASAESEEVQRLRRTVDDLARRNQLLSKEIELERNSVESKIIGEHQNLREQLSSHIQTIGILVAEKTELQAALTQADFIAKKKAAETENYAAKLTDLHQKMTHHERSLNRSSLDGEAQEARSVEQTREIENLRESKRSLEENLDHLRDEVFEYQRKLALKDVEVKSLRDGASDLQSRLDAATARSVSRRDSSSDQSEQLSHEKRQLEVRVQQYQTQIGRLQLDMEEMVSRYQNLLTQANALKDAKVVDPALTSQISHLTKINGDLTEEISRIREENVTIRQSLEEKEESISRTESEKTQQLALVQELTKEIELLRQQSAEDQKTISQLRYNYDQLNGTLSDQSSLLSIMESDKVALSRAMTQNKDLKDRLAVLMAELDQSRQDRVLRDERISALEAELKSTLKTSQEVTEESAVEGSFSQSSRAEVVEERESALPPSSPLPSPAYLKAFEAKVRNLEDEVVMYKNRQLQADSEVIYLKNALRIREEEAKLLDLTERVGAYRNLEHRFVGAMKQNAELLDRVDQLEHVIMQLQGETETIGDYIALYQSQRSLQRQREMEKVAQIDFLNQEREDLKSKLKQLQLVVRNHLLPHDHSASRTTHIDLQQSGDVPDTPPASVVSNGESLVETVSVKTASESSVDDTRVILQLLDDIDSHIKLDPLPPSLSSFSSSNSFITPESLLECSCCTGDLKIV